MPWCNGGHISQAKCRQCIITTTWWLNTSTHLTLWPGNFFFFLSLFLLFVVLTCVYVPSLLRAEPVYRGITGSIQGLNEPLCAAVSLLLEPLGPWANIGGCHTNPSNTVTSPPCTQSPPLSSRIALLQRLSHLNTLPVFCPRLPSTLHQNILIFWWRSSSR